MRKRLMTISVATFTVVLVVVAAALVVTLVRDDGPDDGYPDTDLGRAMAMAPHDGRRFSWTDWAAVRSQVDRPASSAPTSSELERLLDDGFEADLTSTSVLVQSAETLRADFGFSPADVEWELFTQSEGGAAVMIRLPDSLDLDSDGGLPATLDRLGYSSDGTGSGAVYDGSEASSVVARITPELNYLAIDADRHLLLGSDQPGTVRAAVADLDDDERPDLADVVDSSGEAVSAALYTGPQVCGALAMSAADDAEVAQADQLLAAAGRVNPILAFAMAAEADGGIRVSLRFENDEQARTNADTRARLASGPAPGQGGDFGDRFSVAQVRADGDLVTMDLDPVRGAYVLSDLSNGPVLFATC